MWLGPPAAMWFGVRAQLFYTPTVTFGLLRRPRRLPRRTVGDVSATSPSPALAVGLRRLDEPNIAYFILPAALVASVGRRRGPGYRELRVGVPGRAGGRAGRRLAPASPTTSSRAANRCVAVRLPDARARTRRRFGYFFTEGLPGALGCGRCSPTTGSPARSA